MFEKYRETTSLWLEIKTLRNTFVIFMLDLEDAIAIPRFGRSNANAIYREWV